MADVAGGQAQEPTAKVFISYSRKDMAFADRLDAALKVRGFEPLIDRTEIYAFEDWRRRIEALIASADTIVFVLSPDSVASHEAQNEIEYAATLNKRFAPIVCRRVEDSATPEALRRLNFVFFDDPAHFESSADQLAEALRTDIGWVRQHTEFGEVARRWGAAGRPGPRGLLLRSPALEEAERWIASRPSSAPEPTEETRAFIAESRRAATRRRNILSASLGAGLLVALVLAGIAYRERNAAVAQEGIAKEQRETALSTQSRLLAVQATRSTGEGDIQTAILLSLEALRSPGDAGPDRYNVEVEKTLLAALYRNPLRAILRAAGSKYTQAAFLSDASTLATVTEDGSTSFWGIDDGTRIAGKLDVAVPFGPVSAVFADPKRPLLVFRGKDNSYFAWNFQTRQMVQGVTGACSDADAKFLFDASGTRLFVYCSNVSVFNLDTGQAARAEGKFDNFARAPDGQRFVVSADQTVTVMDGATAKAVTTWQHPDPVMGLGMSPDGKTVMIQNYEGIAFRDAETGAESGPLLRTSQARTFGFDVSPTANILVTDGDDGRQVWNVERAAPVQEIKGGYKGFLPNGFLVTFSGPQIRLWEYPTEGHTGTAYAVSRGDFYVAGGHNFLASTADGRKVATLTGDGDIYLWSTDPAMMLHGIADNGERLGDPAAFSTNGKIIVTTTESGLLTVWDGDTLTEINHAQLSGHPAALALSGDGRRLVYVIARDDYDILDVATLRSIKPAGLPPELYTASLSPDGETLAVGYEKTVSLWRVADGSSLHRCNTADVVNNIIWTDKGLPAYAMDQGAVAILDPDTCGATEIFSFPIAPPFQPPMSAEIVSKQGQILAQYANRVQIWSETESKKTFDTTRDDWPVFDESFADSTLFDILPGGRVIVGRQPDQELHIYDLKTQDELLSFTADSNECCNPADVTVLPTGDRLMTLWSERGAFRLRTWRLLPTIADASALARSIVPECLSQDSRHDLGLGPEPPRWCIEMGKRPYNTPQWRQWLSDKDAGKPSPLPEE